jgi:hypothetical protein
VFLRCTFSHEPIQKHYYTANSWPRILRVLLLSPLDTYYHKRLPKAQNLLDSASFDYIAMSSIVYHYEVVDKPQKILLFFAILECFIIGSFYHVIRYYRSLCFGNITYFQKGVSGHLRKFTMYIFLYLPTLNFKIKFFISPLSTNQIRANTVWKYFTRHSIISCTLSFRSLYFLSY